jgi:NAD(P) transhydrogenase subunit alpha
LEGEIVHAGGIVTKDRFDALSNADIICRLNAPLIEEISPLKKGCIHISFLDPFKEKNLIDAFIKASVTAISMELVPRITRAQKMDALSSQASLGGYSAVIEAARRLAKVFPMMMTPAGTISPSKVFIVGVGVAGLQAIATAKRLGARVEAFDTRPVVEEQVLSLGAKFIKIDIGTHSNTNVFDLGVIAAEFRITMTDDVDSRWLNTVADECTSYMRCSFFRKL